LSVMLPCLAIFDSNYILDEDSGLQQILFATYYRHTAWRRIPECNRNVAKPSSSSKI